MIKWLISILGSIIASVIVYLVTQAKIGVLIKIILIVIIIIIIIYILLHVWVKEQIILSLTEKNIVAVCAYNSILKKIENILKDPKILKESQPALKIMCIKGKDIVGKLEDEIKDFLRNGGEALFVFLDPNSQYVDKRAGELERDIKEFRKSLLNHIENIQCDDYKDWYKIGRLQIEKYDFPYTFRMNFIGKHLFLGFYREKVSDYNNIWLHISGDSELYKAMEALFNNIPKVKL